MSVSPRSAKPSLMFKNLLLLSVTVALSLLLVEIVLRFAGTGSYSDAGRVLFYSHPALTVDDQGVVTYVPDSVHRAVAVYGEKIDYDTTHDVNNWGFVDEKDYPFAGNHGMNVAFVGDSFTESAGGIRTWVELLRERERPGNPAFYNFGIGGTGLLHYSRLLREMNRRMRIDELVLVVLSDDFFRPYWYPLPDETGIRFCTGGIAPMECLKDEQPIIHTIEEKATEEDLIHRAKSIYAGNGSTEEKPFYASLNLFNLACDAWISASHGKILNEHCPWLNRTARYLGNPALQARAAQSMSELVKIAADFPGSRVRVIQLPTKAEIISRAFILDPAVELANHSIDYVSLLDECEWSMDMFHTHDDHPNDRGYRNIADCMARVLGY